MALLRRSVIHLAIAIVCLGIPGLVPARAGDGPKTSGKMYGLIGKIAAVEGKRDELIAILLRGTREMPGCLSYVVAKDSSDSTTIWVTEVWTDEASHKASLSLPAVREAIAKGRPLIAKFNRAAATEPVGGQGLSQAKPN